MSDLISRKALCDDLREYKLDPVHILADEFEVKGYNDGIDLAISVIADFPSAEPERKKGKWKNIAFYVCECSECGTQFYELECNNFCPNCGADMRGENVDSRNRKCS